MGDQARSWPGPQRRPGSVARSSSREARRILVVTHIDADGLSSGSIAFHALAAKGAVVSVRAIPDLDLRAIDSLKTDQFDFYLFTDLGSGMIEELTKAFGENFLVVDHHQLPGEHAEQPERPERVELRIRRRHGGLLLDDGLSARPRASTRGTRTCRLWRSWARWGTDRTRGPSRSLTGLNRKALDDAIETRARRGHQGLPLPREGDPPHTRGDSHDLHALTSSGSRAPRTPPSPPSRTPVFP